MILELILIFIIYLFIIITGYYYIDLIITRDEFTKNDLKSIGPYYKKIWSNIQERFSLPVMFLFLAGSALIGLLIPLFTYNWFVNSSIIFAVVFVVLPITKKYFEESQVTATENALDTSANIFIKYAEIIVFGFGAGTAATVMYNWGSSREINFIWFLINIIIITVLLGVIVRNYLNKE